MATTRRKLVGIIGPNMSRCNVDIYNFGMELGKSLVEAGYQIVCGGMHGFMEAVCKGARDAGNYTYGQTVGIIPGDTKEDASEFVDIIIPSGLGWARNQLIVNASDAIISVAGGAGTLSEIAYAWQSRKTVICVTNFGGWTAELAGRNLDVRNKGLLIAADSIEQILNHIQYGVASR